MSLTEKNYVKVTRTMYRQNKQTPDSTWVERSRLTGCTANISKQAYVSERRVGEKREALKQVLVVIVLDHSRPVGLEQKTAGAVKHTHTNSSM